MDVIDACFWQAPHPQLDSYAAFDIRERGRPRYPGIVARRQLESHALRFLGQNPASQEHRRKQRNAKNYASESLLSVHSLPLRYIGLPNYPP